MDVRVKGFFVAVQTNSPAGQKDPGTSEFLSQQFEDFRNTIESFPALGPDLDQEQMETFLQEIFNDFIADFKRINKHFDDCGETPTMHQHMALLSDTIVETLSKRIKIMLVKHSAEELYEVCALRMKEFVQAIFAELMKLEEKDFAEASASQACSFLETATNIVRKAIEPYCESSSKLIDEVKCKFLQQLEEEDGLSDVSRYCREHLLMSSVASPSISTQELVRSFREKSLDKSEKRNLVSMFKGCNGMSIDDWVSYIDSQPQPKKPQPKKVISTPTKRTLVSVDMDAGLMDEFRLRLEQIQAIAEKRTVLCTTEWLDGMRRKVIERRLA